ncbi:hypothetical protein Salat_1922000 [Sesamum alatum]|uniref:Uncharacterized protein n=1 Tax=Sesamum alatum TaxID=300844 RepID=A0AAE2CII1_9LAMI|nr:hypothetical protein Salat_1922000 [Sesamum alatum]
MISGSLAMVVAIASAAETLTVAAFEALALADFGAADVTQAYSPELLALVYKEQLGTPPRQQPSSASEAPPTHPVDGAIPRGVYRAIPLDNLEASNEMLGLETATSDDGNTDGDTESKRVASGGPCLFRFQNMWTHHPDFLSTVRSNWFLPTGAIGIHDLVAKLRRLK